MWDAIVDWEWRWLPSLAMALAGLALAVYGWRIGRGWARHHDPAVTLRFLAGFRLAVIGLALVGVGVAWTWQLGWMLILALAIGGEETLESSIHYYAVNRGIRLGFVPARSGPHATGSGPEGSVDRPRGAPEIGGE